MNGDSFLGKITGFPYMWETEKETTVQTFKTKKELHASCATVVGD